MEQFLKNRSVFNSNGVAAERERERERERVSGQSTLHSLAQELLTTQTVSHQDMMQESVSTNWKEAVYVKGINKNISIPIIIGRSIGGKFLSVKNMFIRHINNRCANAVLSRYYKGIEGDNSNAVFIIKME